MREKPTGPAFAEENARLTNKVLEEVGKVAAAPPAPGTLTAEALRHTVELASGPVADPRFPLDPRPTLRQVLSEQRFGKPPAPAPAAPPASPPEIEKDVLRAKLIEMNRTLAARHAEDESTKRLRDEMAAELARLETQGSG